MGLKNLWANELYDDVELRIQGFKDVCKKLKVAIKVIDNKIPNILFLPKLIKNDLLYKVSNFGYELESH